MSVISHKETNVLRLVIGGVLAFCMFLGGSPPLQGQTTAPSSTASLLPPSTAPGDVVLPNGTVTTNNGATDPGLSGSGSTTAISPSALVARAGACIGGNLLTQQQIDYCNNVAKGVFNELDTVLGTTKNGNTNGAGLGPTFNGNSCAGCHVFPAVGGTSPPGTNPQIGMGRAGGATLQPIPFFVFNGGPIREARFINVPGGGGPDGGVHDLFSIKYRTDNGGCTASVPDFVTQANNHNLIFRIPTPLFGDGLIEAISETTITNQIKMGTLGITGSPNRNGNDGTITRFGWKAQNKSLLLFSGEAYNVEIGVTNEIFPNERDQTPDCQFQPMPEDLTNNLVDQKTPFDPFNPVPLNDSADIENFTIFMRFLAPPTPACHLGLPGLPSLPVCSSAVADGFTQFKAIGCALCHTPTLSTGQKSAVFTVNGDGVTPAFDLPVNLFSDMLLHHIGVDLADGISQGAAGPDQFRSAPLWGLGQRAFFLHDGRTSSLVSTIHFHNSAGSEAIQVVEAFDHLSGTAQEDLLMFLRSL